ncbi:MAG: M1 family aminopeptidase [Candidatus Bathyarchaeia archaeon]
MRGLAHEIAHFWWSFGAGQGDWINESFAEFFSLLAVEENSKQLYHEYMSKILEEVTSLPQDAPPLSRVPFSNDRICYTVRYYKGALMLAHFKELLGDERFFEICREFYDTYHAKTVHTGEFRRFWTQRLKADEEEFNSWLDSEGASPVTRLNQGAFEGP